MNRGWIVGMSLFVFLGCFGCLSLNEYSSTLPGRPGDVNRVLQSTVAIVQERNGTLVPVCSGVFISETQVLTAAHCVQRRRLQEFHLGPFTLTQMVPVRESPVGDEVKIIVWEDYNHDRVAPENIRMFNVVAYDRTRDLALISIPRVRSTSFHHTQLTLTNERYRIGSNVYSIGHPAGLWFTFTSGITSRRLSVNDNKIFVWATADVYFGNSGGPLLNDNGEIVGIVSQMKDEQSHLGASIYVSCIRDFLTNYHRGIIYLELPVPGEHE